VSSTRTTTILRRFPSHLQADDSGKLLGAVVDALSAELDLKTSQLGRTRRAHALGDADESLDLRLLAALHGLRDDDFAVLRLRLAGVDDLRRALPDDDAVARLPTLLGLPVDAFAPFPAEGAVTGPARARLAAALVALVSFRSELELLRRSIATAIALHRNGNGTVHTLLGAGAASLGLELVESADAQDRYWHLARCRDLLRPVRPEPPGTVPTETVLTPAEDLLALEENPFQAKEIDPIDRRHGDVFRVTRGGLEPVTVTVRVIGKATRTVRPTVVNLDTGFGVTYAGSVPAGEELRFESDGRVTLSGASVSRFSYAFRGGVYADVGASHPNDFQYAEATARPERQATFAATEPVPDAFDPAALFPHAEGLLEGATMSLGESRWAFFVRGAHFGRTADEAADELAEPVVDAAVFDESVFAPGTDPSGAVGFAWQEREPFAATLWIPQRFSALDAGGEIQVRERVRLFLDRYRASGVHVYTKYADDRWSLGSGVIRDPDSTDPRGTVVVGTRLWPADSEQPTS
jgi:hypothetical protein